MHKYQNFIILISVNNYFSQYLYKLCHAVCDKGKLYEMNIEIQCTDGLFC